MRNMFVLAIISLVSLAAAQVPETGSENYFQDEPRQEQQIKTPSGKVNVLYSLILPGAGQWAMGYKTRAKFFMGTEFLLWAGFIGSHAYSNVVQDNYQSYATVHAGVNSHQKNEQFWIDIGSSDNIFSFNEQQLRERNLRGAYNETSQNYWQWDSNDSRSYYNDLRVQEHNWEQRATFVVGAFILNRIVSTVDVIRLIRKENKAYEGAMSSLMFKYKTDKKTGSGFLNLNLTVSW